MIILILDFTDAAEYWMFPYDTPKFDQEVDEVWETIRPLYEELHAYIRKRLRDIYGPEKIGGHTPLPAHILGIIYILFKFLYNNIISLSEKKIRLAMF